MHDPISRFQEWFDTARRSEATLPEAMALSTVGPDGQPSCRMVLLKAVDPRGFVFYTNLGSRKVGDLDENPCAALCFHWKSLERQVRVEGSVQPVSDAEADAYFASRDRVSQLGAWASRQSEPLPGRLALETRVARYGARFGVGEVPRPPFWSGFRLVPTQIEFWQALPARLHRRELFTRVGQGWESALLYP